MNTIGQIFRVTTFGESHGAAIGAVIDGCPAGLKWQPEFIHAAMHSCSYAVMQLLKKSVYVIIHP